MSNTTTDYRSLSNLQLIAVITGREVVYSAVKPKTANVLERRFKILDVEYIGVAAKTGFRYVTARVIDHDNADIETHKNLRIQELELLA